MKQEFADFVKKSKINLFAINNLLQRRKWVTFYLLPIGIVILVFFIPKYLHLVQFLGHWIPQKNIQLDYIIGFFWAVFLGLTILIWPVRSQDKKALMWIWAVKCFVMLGIMLYYEYHYETDAFAYFSASKQGIGQWKMMFLKGPNFPVSTIIWLQRKILFLDSFHAAKVNFGMLGFIAIYIFYRSAVVFLRQEKLMLLYIFALFPSILFWSSTLSKEPIVLFGIALYCYGTVKWFRNKSWKSAITLLIGIAIVAWIRPWMGVILAIPVFILTIVRFIKKYMLAEIVTMSLLIGITLFCSNYVYSTFGIKSIKSEVNKRFISFARGGSVTEPEPAVVSKASVKPAVVSKASVKPAVVSKISAEPEPAVVSKISAEPEPAVVSKISAEPEPAVVSKASVKPAVVSKIKFKSDMDIFYAVPKGMFTALFRPFPGEVNNVFGFLAGIEGAFMLILFVLAIKRIRWRELKEPLIIWAILLIGIWAAIYGFVSYNLGTVCRYRLQILPIFLGLLLYLVSRGNWRNDVE